MYNDPVVSLLLSDVRCVFRLIGELREIGSDPKSWRPHLLRRFTQIVPADLIVSSEVHFRTTASATTLKVIDVGWMLESGGETIQIRDEREERPETYWVIIRGAPEEKPAKDQIVPIVPKTKLRGGKSFLLSQCSLPHLGAVDQLGLHRYDTDHAFTSDEHKLVRLFHIELARLWRAEALKRASDPTAALPPRLSQTLEGLLTGSSEKQIAYQLGLSTHTIHNYIRALHRRYDVTSRAELLAKANVAKMDFRPHLSVTVNVAPGRKSGSVPRE